MRDKHYRVGVEGDHIKKFASAKRIQAAAELAWSVVDADATRIDLEIEPDDIAMRSVTIRDNGHGVAHSDIEAAFGKIGGSSKADAKKQEPHPSRQGARGPRRPQFVAYCKCDTLAAVASAAH